jgi:indolepyruvate ferredoxin oxidoreductase beta subunit
MDNTKFDILISGVGGQGTVLASRLLAAAAINQGCFARTSETIGMSQRGGCVVSHVRINSEDSSSIIPFGSADMLIAFELSEAARSLPRLSKDGCCIVNTQIIKPVSASLGNSSYDIEAIKKSIESNSKEVYFIDGYSLAEKAGTVKAVNVVLLGAAAAASKMPLSKDALLEAIIENVPAKFRDLNKNAFELGYSFGKSI